MKCWKIMGEHGAKFLNFSEPSKHVSSAQSLISQLIPDFEYFRFAVAKYLFFFFFFPSLLQNNHQNLYVTYEAFRLVPALWPNSARPVLPTLAARWSHLGFTTPLVRHNCLARSLQLLPGRYRQDLLKQGSRGLLCKVFWPLRSLLQGMFPPQPQP